MSLITKKELTLPAASGKLRSPGNHPADVGRVNGPPATCFFTACTKLGFSQASCLKGNDSPQSSEPHDGVATLSSHVRRLRENCVALATT